MFLRENNTLLARVQPEKRGMSRNPMQKKGKTRSAMAWQTGGYEKKFGGEEAEREEREMTSRHSEKKKVNNRMSGYAKQTGGEGRETQGGGSKQNEKNRLQEGGKCDEDTAKLQVETRKERRKTQEGAERNKECRGGTR